MREIHFCNTCDKKLPYCIRLDRKYCTSRCRVWAFRHPGQKRLDYAFGRKRLLKRPARARPKTLLAALAALDESRTYAAKLEATAQQQHTEGQKLKAELSVLRGGLADALREKAADGDAVRDDLAKTKERLAKAEQQRNIKTKQSHHRLRQTERLLTRVKRAEREVAAKHLALERAQADLEALRRSQEQHSAVQSSKLAAAQSQAADLARVRDDLTKQVQSLTDSAEQLQSRAETVEQELKQRDGELGQERKLTKEAQRAQEEAHAKAESLKRRIESEQARRMVAEKVVQQLQKERGHRTPPSQSPARSTTGSDQDGSIDDERFASYIRQHVDLGQYLNHAVAAGYDITADPLLPLMRRHVVVAGPYADWQQRYLNRITSRRRDFQQTLDEQAYAAVMAARWKLVDYPHIRLGKMPTWSILGIKLDEESEKYLWTIITERIVEMTSRMGTFFQPGA